MNILEDIKNDKVKIGMLVIIILLLIFHFNSTGIRTWKMPLNDDEKDYINYPPS